MANLEELYPTWYFEDFTGRFTHPIKGAIRTDGTRAKFGDIVVEVKKASKIGGTGLAIDYAADDVNVVDIPNTDQSLYEFVGLHSTHFENKIENVSLVGPRGITEDIPSRIADNHYQYAAISGKIEIKKTTLSVEEAKTIKSGPSYQAAVQILSELYTKLLAQ